MSTQTTDPVGVPEWDLADRLHKALRAAKVGKGEMADELGLTRQAVSAYLSGRVTPRTPVVKVWAMKTGVPYEWLAEGTVAHFTGPDSTGGQVIDASGCFSRTANRRGRPLVSVPEPFELAEAA